MAKEQHKGKFVGVYLEPEHYEKVKGIEENLRRLFGGATNTSMAMRYIIENFGKDTPQTPPKGNALAAVASPQ